MVEIESILGKEKRDYLEPFMGFCGVLKHFTDGERVCYACDGNPDIVGMWRSLLDDWVPDGVCTKDDFERLKNDEPSPARTLYGHVCSYGGLFFNTYLNRSYYAEAGTRSILKIRDRLRNGVVLLEPTSYELHNPRGMLVYCDPPYRGNQLQNEYFKTFDSQGFWNTMREWSKDNLVFVSEFEAPDDFVAVWSQSRPTQCKKGGVRKRHTEKLFLWAERLRELELDGL